MRMSLQFSKTNLNIDTKNTENNFFLLFYSVLFQKIGMQKFLKIAVPGYNAPHRKTVAKHFKKEYIDYRKELKKIFEKIDFIAITTDLWKSRNGSHFICITAHFFDDYFNLHSILISFRRFYLRHLAIHLKNMITRELNKLNILEKIVAVTTDNAKDIKKSGSKYE